MNRLSCAVCCAVLSLIWVGYARAGTPLDRYQTAGEVITDTRTGLAWQRTVSANSYTWDEAKNYCAGLGGGWRLPTVKELLTLADPTRIDPSIDRAAFPNTPTAAFWSSTPFVRLSGYAWWVHTFDGASKMDVVSAACRVRCVK
jgi:hypothetical protein